MKITINERVKHRLIGIAVILSLVAIFLPAIMKKSLRSFDDNLNISVELPRKPATPQVAILDEEALFKTTKVAPVELPPIPRVKPVTSLAKVEALSSSEVVTLPTIPLMAKANSSSQNLANTSMESKKKNNTQARVLNLLPPVVNETIPQALLVKPTQNDYVVQLGTFSQLSNATALVKRLHKKGYKATYSKVLIQNKIYYKVIVGQASLKEEAQMLQKKLAGAVQIDGIVVLSKVS